MPQLLSHTNSFCSTCQQTHPAHYERVGREVWFEIDCPVHAQRTCISRDADLFLALRAKADYPAFSAPSFPLRRRFHFLEICDACNIECPLCYAQASPRGVWFMPLEQADQRARAIASSGGGWVSLTGGDPSVHPELLQIIALLRRKHRLTPILLTNGLRLAEEPAFARQLKRAGLRKVQLQFDTFNPQTYLRLRGRTDVNEKFRAIDAVRSAGLRLGLISTICQDNLSEVGHIVHLAASHAPALNTLILQSVAPIGRLPAGIDSLDRETLLHALITQLPGCAVRPDDFWPTPPLPAWQIAVHPDCPANVHLLVDRGQLHPLSRNLDLAAFFARMRQTPAGARWPGLRFAAHLLRSTRPGQTWPLLQHLRGHITGRGKRGVLWITVGGYMHPPTRDDQRIARCPTCCANADGIVGMCERSCSGQNTVCSNPPQGPRP